MPYQSALDALSVNNVGFTTDPTAGGGTGVSTGSGGGGYNTGTKFDPAALAAAMASGVSLAKAGGEYDVSMRGIASAALERQVAEQAQLQAITSYGSAVGEAAKKDAEIAALSAQRANDILTISGINADKADSVYRGTMSKIHETSIALDSLGSEIDNRAAVGMFDNPLEWLVNQVRLPGMVGQYNAIASAQNRSIEQTRNLQSLAGTQLNISKNMDADAIRQAAEAKAAADAAAAQAKLAEVQGAAAGAKARDIATMQAMSKEKFNINLSLAELTKEMYSTGEYANQKEAAAAADQYRLDKVNNYMERIGSTIRYDAKGLSIMPAAKREALVERAGTPYIATKLDEAIAIIDSEGSLDKIASEGDSAAVNWLRGTISDSAAGVKQEATRLMNSAQKVPEESKLRDAILRTKTDQYALETKDMRSASDNNPYRIAYSFMAKQTGMKEFQNNVVTEYINQFGPESKTPAWTKMDEAGLMDYIAAKAMANPNQTGALAQQVASFYTTANHLQALRSKYPLFNMTENKSYNVKLPNVSWALTNEKLREGGVVDLTNAAAVEAQLTKDVARRYRLQKPLEHMLTFPMQ